MQPQKQVEQKFDDMQSDASYMVKIGTDGNKIVDDLSSQGSYMIRGPGDNNNRFNDVESSGSYMQKLNQSDL